MDEVDIEDYNELEARLYGQIHHEAVVDADVQPEVHEEQREPAVTTQRIVTATSIINKQCDGRKVPAGRYWIDKGKSSVAKPAAASVAKNWLPERANKNIVADPKVKAQSIMKPIVAVTTTENVEIEDSESPPPAPPFFFIPESRNENPEPARSTEEPTVEEPPPTMSQNQTQRNLPEKEHNKDLLVNPAAAQAARKTRHRDQKQKHKILPPLPPNIMRDGPFAQQTMKLEKAMRIEAKKQKAKNARAKHKDKIIETIDLDSSGDDDVIMLTVPPPPTINLADSSEDEDKKNVLVKATTAKPNMVKVKGPEAATNTSDENADKSFENSSRCNSPCSVLSSDDFIGQNDRSRLLENSGVADDEDLLLLTADVDSLMAAPRKQDSNTAECASEVQPTNFAPPKSANSDKYRVEQTQFRALDVYESESDITDSVYSKGAAKPKTVIRTIGSSSEEVDNVEQLSLLQKTKRLRKRRSSSYNNRESESNNDGSTDSGGEDNDGVVGTGVPGISRGPAVEHCTSRARKVSLVSRRSSLGGATSTGHMSDHEFIATLNNLAQGGDNVNEATKTTAGHADETDDSDAEDIQAPSARDIAAKVLEKTQANASTTARPEPEQQSDDDDAVIAVPTPSFLATAPAIPDFADLDRVFEVIDKLAVAPKRVSPDDPIDMISDECSDPDLEIVTPPVERNVALLRMKSENNVGPVYNVVSDYNYMKPGGIGWNDEMRKFYNESWNGERFSLQEVQQKMNSARHLWKIYTDDRFPKNRPMSNLKCYNCCEFGHTRAKCKSPKKPPICYMCGEAGHLEPRCPNTICLRCGNKTHVFTKSCNACTFQNRLICPVCKVRGHTINFCPDKWRRYHSTTQPNAYPNSRVVYNSRKMCCICGGRGHFAETCKSAARFMEYPSIVSEIKSHQKSYADISIRTHQHGITVNLLYNPDEKYTFDLFKNTSFNKYYGRFLSAVGMGHLLQRKRKSDVMPPALQGPNKSRRFAKNSSRTYWKQGIDSDAKANSRKNAPDQVQEVTSGSVIIDDDNDVPTETLVSDDSQDVDMAPTQETTSTATECVVVDEVNIDVSASVAADESDAENVLEDQAERAEPNTFKAPHELSNALSVQSPKENEPLHMDSDSNYSFSEHFELPSTSAAAAAAAAAATETTTAKPTPTPEKSRSREMAPLPDFIPLNCEDASEEDNEETVNMQDGISRRFVAADSDENDSLAELAPVPDTPCEAKIYLTQFHSNYLLSPKGHAFLAEKSKACDLKARLDWTSVGHVLVIYGLRLDQDKFHQELLLKYRELMEQSSKKRVDIAKVPKRTDVLIRYLRDNINLLLTNLGNANDLLRRIKFLEKQQTKVASKQSEKLRRLLNMILLGQAGLCEGNTHLDKLLCSLKTLMNDYQSENVVPNEMRDEIDTHSKAIFSSYRHDNYPELLQSYNRMLLKNRLPELNIDPLLLGQKMLDTSLSSEQRERLEISPQKSNQTAPAPVAPPDIVLNPLNPRNSKLLKKKQNSTRALLSTCDSPTPPAPSMKMKPVQSKQIATSTPTITFVKNKFNTPLGKRNTVPPPPFTNPQQKSNVSRKLNEQNIEYAFQCLLTDGGHASSSSAAAAKNMARATDKGPSMFWSRESMKYLDECIKLAKSSPLLLEKLQRVQQKSRSGSLSYNDYRAVIKLYSTMLEK